jgi:hypothetical protein
MTKSDAFWRSVKELAAMSKHIPEERLRSSAVRHAFQLEPADDTRVDSTDEARRR